MSNFSGEILRNILENLEPLVDSPTLDASIAFLAEIEASRDNEHKYKKIIKSLPFWNKV